MWKDISIFKINFSKRLFLFLLNRKLLLILSYLWWLKMMLFFFFEAVPSDEEITEEFPVLSARCGRLKNGISSGCSILHHVPTKITGDEKHSQLLT